MIGLGDGYALHNGVKIPCIGYGTWQMPDNEATVNNIKEAITCGYRHIDTASAYENEASVGKAVRESGAAREGLFITTKLWNSDHGYDNTLRAFEKSISRLQMEYVDLYLIHWPVPVHHKEDYQDLNRETWRAFERLYNEGRVKAIGVSNFLIHHLQEIMQDCEIKPMVNQVELHPEYPQQELADFCKNSNILVEAWSPLMQGRIFQLPLLRELGQKYGQSVSQIAIRWILQKGIVPLPKASGIEHIRQNADVFGFELDKEDMLKIDALKGSGRMGSDPEHIDF